MLNTIKNTYSHFFVAHRLNLAYALLLLLCVVGLETVYRAVSGELNVLLPTNEYLTFIFLFLILSYCHQNVASAFVIFLLVLFFFQMGNYNYFGYFIFPIEIYLFFAKQREVLEVVPTASIMILVPLLGSVVTWLLVRQVDKKFSLRKSNWKMTWFFIAILLLPIAKLTLTKERNQLGSRPNENKSIVKNSIYLSQFFIGKTLPRLLFNTSSIQAWERQEFNIENRPDEYENVVLIIGESLTKNHMSLYGYSTATTPRLEALSHDPDFIVKPAISAGVFTDTAIPAILGVAKQPDATAYIIGARNNLFRLAKQQGFETYFISSQSHDNFSYIRSYMGLPQIDHYIDPRQSSGSDYTSYQDNYLLDELKKIDLLDKGDAVHRRKHFIVLNMAGSHEPYANRYPDQFKKFGDTLEDQYNNSVYYSDYVISSIVEYLENNSSGKSVLMFTSDHGQHVGQNGFGKGNIELPTDYEVPFILVPLHSRLAPEVRQFFGQQDWTSHYEIAATVAYYLGYNSLESIASDQAARQIMYISGGELNGNSGYTELHYSKGNFERIFHY